MADQKKDHIEITENPQGADLENQTGGTIGKDSTQEEDPEKGETAIVIENPLTQDQGLQVDIVGTTLDPQVDQDQMVTDQKLTEMTEIKDPTPKKRERVILAMVDGAEKVARRP